MNFSGVWFLGWRYLLRNRWKALLLIAAFTLVWVLPVALLLVVDRVGENLRERALSTPLLAGRAGSPLELMFNGLYFTYPDLATMTLKEVDAIRETGHAEAIPYYARFSSRGFRIVGTNPDYARFRDLKMAAGRSFLRLGECVVGSNVARELDVEVGGSVISSPEMLFDLAGVYPLKMTVVGELAPTGTADDDTILVDLKTTWIIEGLGHGHQAASDISAEFRIGEGEDSDSGEAAESIRLGAAVPEYNEITPENVDSFHFHGDVGDYPVTGAWVIPTSVKERALLKGDFAQLAELQLIEPAEELEKLLATVFRLRGLVVALLVLVGIAALALGGLVLLLSHRLRAEEFRHLAQLGTGRGMIRALVVFEAGFVIATSLVMSGLILATLNELSQRWGQ
ncbi:MAG: ABC transporter permease [Verrucomicrobiota bacterium]